MIPNRLVPWWSLLRTSAAKHGVDVYVLAGVMDRESLCGLSLKPQGPAGTGDNGHGRGLMQIDDRAFPDFCAERLFDGTLAWQDPATNIDFGASVLAAGIRAFSEEPDFVRLPAGIAAYNAGAKRVVEALAEATYPVTHESVVDAVDHVTTGMSYASDVLGRAAGFKPPITTKEPTV